MKRIFLFISLILIFQFSSLVAQELTSDKIMLNVKTASKKIRNINPRNLDNYKITRWPACFLIEHAKQNQLVSTNGGRVLDVMNFEYDGIKYTRLIVKSKIPRGNIKLIHEFVCTVYVYEYLPKIRNYYAEFVGYYIGYTKGEEENTGKTYEVPIIVTSKEIVEYIKYPIKKK